MARKLKMIEPIDDSFENVVKVLINQNTNKNIFSPDIRNNDCLIELKNIDDNSIDIVITDPPYFLDGLNNNWDKDKLKKKSDKANVVGSLPVGMKFDPKQGKDFQEFYSKVSKEIFRVLKPGSFFISFSQPRLYHRMAVAVEDEGFEIRDQYVWYYKNKSQMKAFSMNHFIEKRNISDSEKKEIIEKLQNRKTPQLKPQFESILLAQKPKKGTFIDNWLEYEVGLINASITLNAKYPTTVMQVEKPSKEKYNCHLTVKPVKLIEHLIKIFSTENQIVLDPFLGSGTTAIACKNTNRKCIGIEINPEYIIIAEKRLKEIYNE